MSTVAVGMLGGKPEYTLSAGCAAWLRPFAPRFCMQFAAFVRSTISAIAAAATLDLLGGWLQWVSAVAVGTLGGKPE